MFQDWTHESDYKSLLPKQKPKPATGIDLLGRRHSRLGIGLEHYDIPGQGMVETSPSTPEPETPKAEIPPRAKDDGLAQATTETGTEHSPESSETEPEPKPEAESPDNNVLPAQPEKAAPTDKPDEPAEGILEIEASVDYLSGRSNVPAYHTEFFITTQDLNDILSSHPEIQEEFEKPGKNISSYAELWARAQKYGYNYPGLASKIRNALKDDGAHRIRTNAVGKAQIRLRGKEQLQGRRYIIGVSSLGTVGVVWSKEFLIQDYAGNNKLLTLDGKDAIWLQ